MFPDDDSRQIVYQILDAPESEHASSSWSLTTTFLQHAGNHASAYLVVFVQPESLSQAERAEILEGSFYHRPSKTAVATSR